MRSWQEYCDPANWHEAAQLFPLMDQDELQALADDIKTNGQRNPVILFNDKVLDGRNRLLACKLAGTHPRFEPRNLKDQSPIAWVLSHNLHRRHLSPTQRAFIAVEAEKLFAVEAKARQKTLNNAGGNIATSVRGKARDHAAKALNVSPRYVSDAKRIAQQSPETAAAAKAGKVSMAKAKTVLPKAEQASDADMKTLIAQLSQAILTKENDKFEPRSPLGPLYWWSRNKVRLRTRTLGLSLGDRRILWHGISERIWQDGWRGNTAVREGRREAFVFQWSEKNVVQESMPEDWAPMTDVAPQPVPLEFFHALRNELNVLTPATSNGEEHVLVMMLRKAPTEVPQTEAEKLYKDETVSLLRKIAREFEEHANAIRDCTGAEVTA